MTSIFLGRNGQRGIIMDLDLVILTDRPADDVSLAPIMVCVQFSPHPCYALEGSQNASQNLESPYLALTSLKSCSPTRSIGLRYDRLDDLECLYYVFVVLMYNYTGNGASKFPRPTVLDYWLHDNIDLHIFAKLSHFSAETVEYIDEYLEPWWSLSARKALLGCHKILDKVLTTKKAVEALNTEEKIQRMKELVATSDEYYSQMVKELDTALNNTDLGPEAHSGLLTPFGRRRKGDRPFRNPSKELQSRGKGLLDELYSAHFEDSPAPSHGSVAVGSHARLSHSATSTPKRKARMEDVEVDSDSPLRGKGARAFKQKRATAQGGSGAVLNYL